MNFEVEDKEKYKKWLNSHKCKFINPANTGAIGGRLTYIFTPTSLGCISKVQCACSEEIDTTIYDW